MKKSGIAFIACIALLSSCSKENIFSYYLKGKWTIDRLDVKETTDTIASNYSEYKAGTYIFDSNNEGSLTTSMDTTKPSTSFKWSAEGNSKVILTFENQNIEEWNVLSDKPQNQIWENTSIIKQSSGGISATTSTYKKVYLKKIN